MDGENQAMAPGGHTDHNADDATGTEHIGIEIVPLDSPRK
jgi:hypothetical protein